MRGLNGRVAVVTGGAGGIGKAIARRLLEEGCAVAIFDVNGGAAAATVQELSTIGAAVHEIVVDITDHAAVGRAVAAAEARLGAVDVLVNNAGWDRFIPFLETTPELWQKIIRINLDGALNMHHHVLPGMVARRTGKVVNIASDAARVGSSGEAVYAACKAGLIALSKTLAREHARHGICFNVVSPGPTETALLQSFADESSDPARLLDAFRRAVPMRRLGKPEDVPGLVAFLASDDADFITGQVISVSGGLTMNG